MGTNIRARLSKNNKYWISTHRYYELKHFCLQYKEWEKLYKQYDIGVSSNIPTNIKNYNVDNFTESQGIELYNYSNKIKMVNQAALEADDYIHSYILKSITEGLSYNTLKNIYNIPCGRDFYYDRYRKFFYILDKMRN